MKFLDYLIVGLITFIVAVVTISAQLWAVVTIWGLVVVSIFNGPAIDYGQALALLIALNIVGSIFRRVAQPKLPKGGK